MAGLRAASQPRGACAPAASPSFRTTQSGRGRAGGRAAEVPRPADPGLAPAGGAHLAVPPPEDHGEGPVSHEVPLAVLEVAHHLHGRAPGAYSGRAGGRAAQRGGPGSAPRARRPGERPRAAGLGQPRPPARADAHAERPERKQGRPPRGAGVSEAWPGPGRSSWPGPPPAEGSLGEAASALPSQGRRSRHCAPPEPHTRPGEVRGPVFPIPSSSGRVGPLSPGCCCGGGRRPRTSTTTVPARLPASQRRSTHTRARRPLPSRLPALRDVSTPCRTQRPPKPAPSARKMSARAPRGAALPSRPVPQSLAQAGNWDASRWNHSSLPASAFALGLGADSSVPRPGLRGGRRGSGS